MNNIKPDMTTSRTLNYLDHYQKFMPPWLLALKLTFHGFY